MPEIIKAIQKLTNYPFLFEQLPNWHILIITDKHGIIQWVYSPKEDHMLKKGRKKLLHRAVSELYETPEFPLSNIRPIAFMREYYGGLLDPNGKNKAIWGVPYFRSKNIFETESGEIVYKSIIPLSSIRFLTLNKEYLLGIIHLNIEDLLKTSTNKLSLLTDHNSRIIGFGKAFEEIFMELQPALGKNLSEVITVKEDKQAEEPICYNNTGTNLTLYRSTLQENISHKCQLDFIKEDYTVNISFRCTNGILPTISIGSEENKLLFAQLPSQLRKFVNGIFLIASLNDKPQKAFRLPITELNTDKTYTVEYRKQSNIIQLFFDHYMIGAISLSDLRFLPSQEDTTIEINNCSDANLISLDVSAYKSQKSNRVSTTIAWFKSKPEKKYRLIDNLRAIGGPIPIKREIIFEDLSLYEKFEILKTQKENDTKELTDLKTEIQRENALKRVVGESAIICKLKSNAAAVARTDNSIIIFGETGTGKSLLAETIHLLSHRNNGPFISIDCATLPETLIESELFGFKKGAFTGATETTKGKLELAHNGTLFLDEIGNLSLSAQAKLLTFLHDHSFMPIGSNKRIYTDVRVITATNKNLLQLIMEKKFRDDLYYRLNVLNIECPPLRERLEDIPIITDYLFHSHIKQLVKNIDKIERSVYVKLLQYDWPGNIRELYNLLLRSATLCEGKILKGENVELPDNYSQITTSIAKKPKRRNIKYSAQKIAEAIDKCKGNISWAADMLGISRMTIYKHIKLGVIQMPSEFE